MKLLFFGTVKDGSLYFNNRKRFNEDIKAFEGKTVEVTISKKRKGRSTEQNSYYWGVCIPCAVQGFRDAGNLGVTVEIAHSFFKDRFLFEGTEIILPLSGEVVVVNKTTTTLSTTQMADYILQITKFCAEYLGVVIPDPMPLFENGVREI